MKTKLSRSWKVCLALGLAGVLSQLLFPGCATLLNGPNRHVQIETDPPKAKVFINDALRGETPFEAKLLRWGIYQIRVEMPGYEPCEFRLKKELNPNVLGNAIIGAAPIVIDVLSGAIWLQSPAEGTEEKLQKEGFRLTEMPVGVIADDAMPISISASKDAPPRGRQIATMKKAATLSGQVSPALTSGRGQNFLSPVLRHPLR